MVGDEGGGAVDREQEMGANGAAVITWHSVIG